MAEKTVGSFCGFRLARFFEEEQIQHIHAPFAHGPAMAAWVASTLRGIPFGFTGRAVDIYPPDGALSEKIRDSVLVRANTRCNVNYLQGLANGEPDKIRLVYNGYPLKDFCLAPGEMKPPFRFLSLCRFARFNGFDVLLRAATILRDQGLDFQLSHGRRRLEIPWRSQGPYNACPATGSERWTWPSAETAASWCSSIPK